MSDVDDDDVRCKYVYLMVGVVILDSGRPHT